MENEERTNAKQAGADVQYKIRKDIIRLTKAGKTGKEIAKLLDVSEGHVSGVKKAYRQGGMQVLAPKRHGRKLGEKRTLSPQQEREICSCIIDKTPEQLSFKQCMWTRAAVRDLIQRKYKITMPCPPWAITCNAGVYPCSVP